LKEIRMLFVMLGLGAAMVALFAVLFFAHRMMTR
jgi:hypothetical protein